MAATDPSTTRPDEYFVAVIVDGVDRTFEVADLASGQALADDVLSAAERRMTVRLAINDRSADGALTPIGATVLDFGAVTRTEVFVDRREMAGGEVGIKR